MHRRQDEMFPDTDGPGLPSCWQHFSQQIAPARASQTPPEALFNSRRLVNCPICLHITHRGVNRAATFLDPQDCIDYRNALGEAAALHGKKSQSKYLFESICPNARTRHFLTPMCLWKIRDRARSRSPGERLWFEAHIAGSSFEQARDSSAAAVLAFGKNKEAVACSSRFIDRRRSRV